LLGEIDYNGWTPDGQFRFGTFWSSFSDLQSNSPFESHGVLLGNTIFAGTVPTPSNFASSMVGPVDMALHANSNAVDAGLVLPNINDNFNGGAPDLGAFEVGIAPPIYGARSSFPRPLPPTGLTVR
jgi:hypothetical protein